MNTTINLKNITIDLTQASGKTSAVLSLCGHEQARVDTITSRSAISRVIRDFANELNKLAMIELARKEKEQDNERKKAKLKPVPVKPRKERAVPARLQELRATVQGGSMPSVSKTERITAKITVAVADIIGNSITDRQIELIEEEVTRVLKKDAVYDE